MLGAGSATGEDHRTGLSGGQALPTPIACSSDEGGPASVLRLSGNSGSGTGLEEGSKSNDFRLGHEFIKTDNSRK